MSTSAQTFLIAGCDDIGTRLGPQPAAQRWNVDALHRHTTALPPPLVAIRADLTDPARVRARPGDADFVLYPATAARVDEQHARTACVDGVRNVLVASPSPNFVSSPAARSTASGWWKPFARPSGQTLTSSRWPRARAKRPMPGCRSGTECTSRSLPPTLPIP